MNRQIVITLPEWTEIKHIDHKQFADLLPAYDEMLNMIKNATPLSEVLEDIKAELRSCAEYDAFGDYQKGLAKGCEVALSIIERHTSGKE